MGKGPDEASTRARFEAAGQGHVFQYVDALPADSDERALLLKQLSDIPVEDLSSWLASAKAEQQQLASPSSIRPSSLPVGRSTDKSLVEESRKIGLDAISNGTIAVLVLAGGQGTRLGFEGPKGLYDIGLPSGRTLFQMLAERIVKLKSLAQASGDKESASTLPLYIMTSPINHEQTERYFKEHDYFGLPAEDIKFFSQDLLPCLRDSDGKIIMESSKEVAMAPNGNGGVYLSLEKSGMLADMEQRGINGVHAVSIDNALTRPADPVFVGYCLKTNADCGNKVVWKSEAHERVGVLAETGDGKPCIVEYSDISKEMAERTLEDDPSRLVFGAGNICNHYFSITFLRETVLPNLGAMYHVAHKAIPYFDDAKMETVKPDGKNGYKLESFIFDVFPMSQNMVVWEVQRSHEFAPVKNASGSDSPATARTLSSNLARYWVESAGGTITDGDNDGEKICEISPLTSYAGEGMESVVAGKEVECPFSL